MKKSEKRATGYRPAHTCFTGDSLLDAIVESSQGGGSENRKDNRREQKFSGYEASVNELAHIYMGEKISVRQAQIEDGGYPDMDSPKWQFICRDEVLNGCADAGINSLIFSKIGAIVNISNACVTYRVIYGADRVPMGTFFATFKAANNTCYTIARRYDRLKSYPGNVSIWVAEKTGQIFNMGVKSMKQGLPLTQFLKGVPGKEYNAVQTKKGDIVKVHHLVADTWCQQTKERWPKCDADTLVRNHIDENKYNNAAVNLEFCSQGYNNRYSQLAKAARTKLPRMFSLPEDYDILEKYARGDLNDCSEDAFIAAIANKHNKN